MPEDRSLDEFGRSVADAEAAETEPADVADGDSPSTDSDDGNGVDEVTPATATATWTTGGADCERCGDGVERRWLDDGDRVCPDCKSW